MIIGILSGTKLSYSESVLSKNPVGFWLLNETTGTNANDLTTNNNDLTYENSPTLNVNTNLNGLTKAITLNGIDERAVNTTNPATFNQNPSGNWSMEIWLKFSATNFATPYTVRNTDAVSTTTLGVITVNNSTTGRIQVLVLDSTAVTFVTLNSDGSWNDNNWHHVVVTAVSGGALTLYVDGVSRASSTTARHSDTTNKSIYVGSNVSSQYYDGSLSAPALYSTTLTEQQIIDNYRSGL